MLQDIIELDRILDAVYNGIVAVNLEGRIIAFNKAAARMTGIPVEESLGKRVDEIILDTGLPGILASGESKPTQKMRLRDKVVISNRTPIYSENGKLIGAIGVFQDVSELEKITQELKTERKLKKELDEIVESSYDGIWITDGDGYTLHLNSAYERISGLKKEEVVGYHMQELLDKGYFSDSVTLHVLKKKERVTIMHDILKTGKRVLITGNPIFDEKNQIRRVVTNVRDITELIELKEELEAKERLAARYEEELARLRSNQLKRDNIVIQSAQMQHTFDLAIRVGQVDSTVLILGESGVGKEVIAHVIVQTSVRKDGPFIKVNCGAIPENLLESELFGYEKGAFTGADRRGKLGMFELAHKGTILLDEVAEISPRLQVKLLRVFQDHEIRRIGGRNPIKLDVRVLAATNKDLQELVDKGRFREDLYYRLNVIPLTVPPLRERKDDIPALINYFLKMYSKKYKVEKQFSVDVIDCLMNYFWPGNVRELQNLIERLVVLSRDSVITMEQIPQHYKPGSTKLQQPKVEVTEIIPIKEAVFELEKQLLQKALKKYKTTRKAAEALGVNQSTVVRKLKKMHP